MKEQLQVIQDTCAEILTDLEEPLKWAGHNSAEYRAADGTRKLAIIVSQLAAMVTAQTTVYEAMIKALEMAAADAAIEDAVKPLEVKGRKIKK